MSRFRFHEDVAVYFLTFSVIEWLPVFIEKETCQIVTENLNHYQRTNHLRINAFVIMPTHLHLIAFDAAGDTQRLAKTIANIRKYTGRSLLDHCATSMPAAFSHSFQSSNRTDRTRQMWQSGVHPVGIATRRFWKSKFDYIHDNPCRKGLVREPSHWRYSSAAYWLNDPPGESDVILTGLPS